MEMFLKCLLKKANLNKDYHSSCCLLFSGMMTMSAFFQKVPALNADHICWQSYSGHLCKLQRKSSEQGHHGVDMKNEFNKTKKLTPACKTQILESLENLVEKARAIT